MDDLLRVCLPMGRDTYTPQSLVHANGVTVRSDSLNLRVVRRGLFELENMEYYQLGGLLMGMTCPLLHVARYQGRMYLRNGYHRAYALQAAGVTHAPCLIIDTDLFENTGAQGAPETFTRDLLESENPPTCAHYSSERAFPVSLRRLSKVISVAWTEAIFVEP
ncbi:MAG: hypothetical protein IT303_04690 [Dehalococcoidia bacterium]|nr:hypothetical protein [Dehalococcoidia bacterium]